MEPQAPFAHPASCEVVELRPPLRVALDAARAVVAVPVNEPVPLTLRVALAVAMERMGR